MTRTKKSRVHKERVWWVNHPDYTVAVVRAPSWELATVEAAEWWGVPWGKVAALCECSRVEKIITNVCVNCGNVFEGEGLRCTRCEVAARDAELNRRARDKRFYREMMPRKGAGQ